jgi:hypothetical protein
MELNIVFMILAVHWLADFKLQSHWMATNKSKSYLALHLHTGVYTLVWAIVVPFYTDSGVGYSAFLLTTFTVHTFQDAITSRITSKLYAKGNFHWFFSVIGIDQFLHYVQLLLCWKYMVQTPI